MSAAAGILIAVIFDLRRVIGVSGARDTRAILPLRLYGILVFYENRQRRARCKTAFQAAENLRLIGLPPRRLQLVPVGGTATHEMLQLFEIERLARRKSVQHDADSRAAALSKQADSDSFTPA